MAIRAKTYTEKGGEMLYYVVYYHQGKNNYYNYLYIYDYTCIQVEQFWASLKGKLFIQIVITSEQESKCPGNRVDRQIRQYVCILIPFDFMFLYYLFKNNLKILKQTYSRIYIYKDLQIIFCLIINKYKCKKYNKTIKISKKYQK